MAANCCRVPVTTQFDGPIRIAGRPKITLGQHCRLGREVFFESGGQGRIVLDNNVRLNAGVVVVAHAEVKIESDVLVGEYVSIRDADHAIQPDQLIRFQDHVANPVSIGRGAWIGRGAAILKGVHIGAGAVIGANSVVTSDIPENAIAVGVPARVLRYRDGSLPSP